MNNSLFISHGAPDIILTDNPAADALREIAAQHKPAAIVVVSAHWIDDPIGITAGEQLKTHYDFGGFSPALYEMKYPARGNAALSEKIQQLLQQQGMNSRLDMKRGLDHGAWIPLKIMYPEADIPVVQVSLPAGSLHEAARLGEALAPLREENVLIIGSGGSVHNLHELSRDGVTADWVLEFENWLLESIEGNHFDQLIEQENFPDNFRKAHPTIEHYAPLVVAWAAGNVKQAGRRIHHSLSYTNLGMSMFEFGSG